MTTNEFNKRFDSYYNALSDYQLYCQEKGIVDETDNLPAGIHASVIRYQPTHPDLDEEEETNTKKNDEDWQLTDWDDPDEEF